MDIDVIIQLESQSMTLYKGRQAGRLEAKILHVCDFMTTAISCYGIPPSQPTLMRGLKPSEFAGDITLSIS